MRRLTSEDGDDLAGLPLEVERLQVVGKENQVQLGAKAHRRMPPIAVRKDSELSTGNDPLYLVLHGLQFDPRVPCPATAAAFAGSALGISIMSTQSRADR